ncbi:predicted protein [Lichtheimia corymbifera JMRC:FSU:9682]|uniref:Uncharacterized protein n=1 Tax=Lichtheimia corymbifera JMRC:FSU:9682 TaxID=1263082 RepID=A0A068S3S6_9FUNG|nr:predicted protein [Lichtheimia corymbifera JMRC:FSU:9682]
MQLSRSTAMEAADLDGALEYLTRVPSNAATDILQDTFRSTLQYYDHSSDARVALSRVLFRAWHFKDVSRSDFSVSRFERGITTKEFLALMDNNDLFIHIMGDVYLLPYQDALAVLQEMMSSDDRHATRFLVPYMRIANAIALDQDFMDAIAFITTGQFASSGDEAITLQKLLAEQLKTCKSSRKIYLLRVQDVCLPSSFASKVPDNQLQHKRRRIHVNTQENKTTTNIKEEWRDNDHTMAFILLCERMQEISRPFPSLAIKECLDHINILPDHVFDDLQQKLSQNNDALSHCKQQCLKALHDRYPSWQSILKLMVQYTDLWIDEWTHPNVMDIFVAIIRDNHMIVDCYHNLYKALYRIPAQKREQVKLEQLCRFFRKLLESVDSKNELMAIRNYIFQHMTLYHGVEYNLFNDFQELDFNGELTRLLNQCSNKHVSWDHATKGLTVLSIFWPYKVISEIASQCVVNQDKQKTMIPVLRQLGGLAKLGISHDGKSATLLGHYLQALISQSELDFLRINVSAIASLFKMCCSSPNSSFEEYPGILIPRDHVRTDQNVLFDSTDFIVDELPLLLSARDDQWTMMELGLRMLDALYGSDKVQHKRFRDANVIKSAVLSNAAPVDLCFAMTEVLETRYTLRQSTAPSIQLLEMAFNLLKTTLHALMQSTDIVSSEEAVNGIFAQLEMNYDWRTCMLWSDFQFTLQMRHDPTKAKLSIPRSLEPMVDTLDGTCRLYGTRSHAHQTCWDVLFDACKLSPVFTEKLFSTKHVWKHHLETLCQHPMEDTIVTHHLYQSLFPSLSLSVSVEYEQLLVDFLDHLYDSFDAHHVVVDFAYTDDALSPFAKMLTKRDAKIFYKVLYCTSLLGKKCPSDASKASQAYFVNCIVRILQGIHNWADPFPHYAQNPSLNSVRDDMYMDPYASKNVAGIYDGEDQPLEGYDMENPQAFAQQVVVIDVFYPLYNDEMASRKALSLLTLCLVCESILHVGDDDDNELSESIRVFMLQIIEGLRDARQRRLFRELAATQLRSRLVKWRKASGQKRRAILRPLLSDQEEKLMVSYFSKLGPERSNALIRLLQEEQQVSSRGKNAKKHTAIYCVPPHNKPKSTPS